MRRWDERNMEGKLNQGNKGVVFSSPGDVKSCRFFAAGRVLLWNVMQKLPHLCAARLYYSAKLRIASEREPKQSTTILDE
jgi:hypothetical protein